MPANGQRRCATAARLWMGWCLVGSQRLSVALAFSSKPPGTPLRFQTSAEVADPSSWDTKSSSAPRFDDFCESLVGGWFLEEAAASSSVVPPGLDDSNNTNGEAYSRSVGTVEEVMRSCGGAVQGIREPATATIPTIRDGSHSGEDEEIPSTYLNRANDGFVFFGDGCYTMGPTSMEISDENGGERQPEEEAAFLSCLVLPNTDGEGRKQRIVLSVGEDSAASGISEILGCGPESTPHIPHLATLRTKQKFGDAIAIVVDGSGDGQDANSSVSSPNDEAEEPVVTIEAITKMTRCRMPSQGQPWMLQRSKWETLLPLTSSSCKDDCGNAGETNDGDNTNHNTVAASNDNETKEPSTPKTGGEIVRSWVISEPSHEFYQRWGLPAIPGFSQDGIVLQCGVACPVSKTLRLVVHQYDCQGKSDSNNNSEGWNGSLRLCGILRIEGTVRFD